jgi:hypothetical protein
LCKICDQEVVEEVFFGTEDEPDAMFVLLQDCGHVIESSGMDGWIESRFGLNAAKQEADSNSKNNSIQLPECPKCRTPIRLNLRYSNYIKQQLEAIEKIKRKASGNGDAIETARLKKELLAEIEQYEPKDSFVQKFYSDVKEYKLMPYNELLSNRNIWEVRKRLVEIKKTAQEKLCKKPEQIQHMNFELKKIFSYMFDEKTREIFSLNYAQLLEDILAEIERIECVFKYYQFKNKVEERASEIKESVKVAILLVDLETLIIKKANRFERFVKEKANRIISELKKLVDDTITEAERLMVVNAIGLSKGHWFQCRNGHVYAIGECGGAMETARCPDCKEIIGGRNHALDPSNRLAGHMDGASHAAWSDTANNMRNWNLNI